MDVLDMLPLDDVQENIWQNDHFGWRYVPDPLQLACRQGRALSDSIITSVNLSLNFVRHERTSCGPVSWQDGLDKRAAYLKRLSSITKLTLSDWASDADFMAAAACFGAATCGQVDELILSSNMLLSPASMSVVSKAFLRLAILELGAG